MNAATIFVVMKPWEERTAANETQAAILQHLNNDSQYQTNIIFQLENNDDTVKNATNALKAFSVHLYA
jgi:hypothetical protein